MKVTTENFSGVLPKALIKRIDIFDRLGPKLRIWQERCSKDGDAHPDEELQLDLRIIISAQTAAPPMVPGPVATYRDTQVYGDDPGLLHDPNHSKLPYRIILMLVTSAAEMDSLKRDNSYVREQIGLIGNPNAVAVFSRDDPQTVASMTCSKLINDGAAPKVYYEDFEYMATVTAPAASKSIPYLGLYCTTAYYNPGYSSPRRGESFVILGEPNIQRIMVNNRVPLTSKIFHLRNKPDTAWAGPIHLTNSSLMARDHHIPIPHPGIYPEIVSNQKICDHRLLPGLTTILGEDDSFLRRPADWLTNAPDNLFSPLYFSTTRKGQNRLLFNVNLKNIALSHTHLAPKFANMDALRDCFKISGVTVKRHSQTGKEAQRLTRDQLLSEDHTAVTVATVQDGEIQLGNVEFQSSDYSYGSTNPDILTIIATEDFSDATIGKDLARDGGQNYYSVVLTVEDHTVPALQSLIAHLTNALNKFDDFWSLFSNTIDRAYCGDGKPNADNPKMKSLRDSWIDLIDKYLSALRFIKGEDIFCPEDINYFKKNLTTLVNPYALDNVDWQAGHAVLRQLCQDALDVLHRLSVDNSFTQSDGKYSPRRGLATSSVLGFTKGIPSFEIEYTFQSGYANEPAHGHTEITGYSYLNDIFVTDSTSGLASISYSNYAKRVNQEALRFPDANAAKANTYGFLSPLHVEYSVGSDNRVIINDLTPVDQLFDLLQARFDPAGSVAQGNPTEAKQTVFEYSSVTVKNLKSGSLRRKAGSANLDGQNELINPDTGRPYGSDDVKKANASAGTLVLSTPSVSATEIINPDTGRPYSNNDDTLGDADSADYVGADAAFVHQDGADDQDSVSQTETHIKDSNQTSAFGSQPATMMLLTIAFQGSAGFTTGPPEYRGTNSIGNSLMAADLTLLQDPNEHTVAFNAQIGDNSPDDSNLGLNVTKLSANSVAGTPTGFGTSGFGTDSGQLPFCTGEGQNAPGKSGFTTTRLGSYLFGSILGKSFGNPMWFDLRYNNVVRVEYQKLTNTSGGNNNEGWELLTGDIFNSAMNSKLPLLCRMVTCEAVTTNAIPWSTIGFNRVFILGDTFVTTNIHHTRYTERINAYIASLKKVNVITDVKRINIGSEYLCDTSMIFTSKKTTYASVLPAGKRSHTTTNRLKRLHGASYVDLPARTRSGRRKGKFQRATTPVAIINPDTGQPYGSSR